MKCFECGGEVLEMLSVPVINLCSQTIGDSAIL
jgi:hypothetical protein